MDTLEARRHGWAHLDVPEIELLVGDRVDETLHHLEELLEGELPLVRIALVGVDQVEGQQLRAQQPPPRKQPLRVLHEHPPASHQRARLLVLDRCDEKPTKP